MDWKDLKARVVLVLPTQCDTRGCELDEETLTCLLEATQHRVPLQELQVVYEQSGDFDQTALALEHLRWDPADPSPALPTHLKRFHGVHVCLSPASVRRFFYKHIWRQWDEEDEDDDFDYFVRCVEPRLRL